MLVVQLQINHESLPKERLSECEAITQHLVLLVITPNMVITNTNRITPRTINH